MKRTIVPRGILALSLVVVLLGATASTASAERVLTPWYCPPLPTQTTTLDQIPQNCLDPFGSESFGFGDRQLGTTSPAQRFALGVYNVDTLTPNISVSGDYAQTNNCPPTLSVTANPQVHGCLITVTFTPADTGPKRGTLSTGPGGPTVPLTGTGVTTPTPPALPMLLSVPSVSKQTVAKKLKYINATTNNDSTLVARGSKIKKTTKQLAAGETTRIKPRFKHMKRLREKPTRPKVKIKFAATDEFDQTATEEIKVTLCRRIILTRNYREVCRWHRSQK
jgi:hypothetical protein